MAKQWQEITLKPLQPIHIGTGNYGVVNPTEIFLPGFTMWGAFTAALGEFLELTESAYRKLNIDPFLEISNFYPIIDNDLLLPEYKDGVFHFGKYPEKEFRFFATESFTSTAINPQSQSAKDKMLHEIEYLLPQMKTGEEIMWRGIVHLDLSLKIGDKEISEFLNDELTIFVGGERSRGFSMMKLIDLKELNEKALWNIDNEDIQDRPFAHYLKTTNNSKIKGEAIWRYIDISTENSSLKISNLVMVYKPGCYATVSNLKLKKGIMQEKES